jgi:hypothetical protein
MKNGNAFSAFINDTMNLLSALNVVEYYAASIPATTDEQLRAIIGRFMAATPEERETFQSTLTKEHRSLFGIYGHRAATIAARKDSSAWLLSGLVSAAIANYTIPIKRQVEVGLAVYHHVARKLNLKPIDLFEEAAVYAAADIARQFLTFGRRGDVTLSKFGWQELKTQDGVKYKFKYG